MDGNCSLCARTAKVSGQAVGRGGGVRGINSYHKLTLSAVTCKLYKTVCYLQRKGQEGFDPDFDEESTMVEDTVTPHT